MTHTEKIAKAKSNTLDRSILSSFFRSSNTKGNFLKDWSDLFPSISSTRYTGVRCSTAISRSLPKGPTALPSI